MIYIILVKIIIKSAKSRYHRKEHPCYRAKLRNDQAPWHFFKVTVCQEKICNIKIETEHYRRGQEKYHEV